MTYQPQQRPAPEQRLAVVRRCVLFNGLDVDVLTEVAEAIEWWCVPGGETLARVAGGGGGGAYLVLHGKLRVTHESRQGSLAQYDGVGDLLGPANLLVGESDPFTAVALQDSEVGLITRQAFAAAAERCPVLWRRLAEEVGREIESLLRGTRSARSRVRHVAVLPADDDEPLITEFCARFAGSLRAHAPRGVMVVDRAAFDGALGVGAADNPITYWDDADRTALQWINSLTDQYDLVLFQADPKWTEWTQRCIRQSESVVVVSGSASDRRLTVAERALLSGPSKAQRDYRLVLVHPAGMAGDPTGTDEWLDRRPGIKRVHHLRRGVEAHYDRLARHLTGTAVGLVLGGGGARGQAHLGVVKALDEWGVHVDAVGGTSAGGGIAALTTDAQDFQTRKAMVRTAFVEMAPFQAYSLPFHSLMSKPRVEAPAKFLGGDRLIEDLWLPYFCVSCDIGKREKVVHLRGRLWKALCATTALPGVLPPMVMRGKVLVDGGVVDNIPVEPMREITAGPLIVVDVGAEQNNLVDSQVLDLPVNAAVILSYVHPLLDPLTVPSLLTVVMSTMDLADKVRRRERADLEIRPPIGEYGITDFKAQDELVAIGYNAAIAALRAASNATLARLGMTPAAIDRLRAMREPAEWEMPVPTDQSARRRRNDRVFRAFARAAGALLLGLALAGALQSAAALTLAVIAALLVLLASIVLPAIRAHVDVREAARASGEPPMAGAS